MDQSKNPTMQTEKAPTCVEAFSTGDLPAVEESLDEASMLAKTLAIES
jgi:hypothetical protein